MLEKDLYNLNKLVCEYHDNYCISSLGASELDELNRHSAEVAFYWYGAGSYEGSGRLIFMKDEEWHLVDLGHCSCYGPDERIRDYTGTGYSSFEDLEKACSHEYYKSVLPLLELAKSKGYGSAKPDEIIIGIL